MSRERQGNLELALKNYQKALYLIRKNQADKIQSRVNPADIHLNIATLYWQLGNYPKALEHYRKMLQLDPSHPKAKAIRSFLRSF